MKAKYLEVSGRTYYAFEEPDFVGPRLLKHEAEISMPTVEKYGTDVTYEGRFWRRQFGAKVTSGQRKFDWLFGVIMPTICFFFDPIVFSGAIRPNGPLLGPMKTFAFVLSFVAIMGLMASMLFGEKLKWFNAALAGLFATSAGFSLFVGLAISPFSLLGMIILIGLLGFTPLLTSLVYFRNAVRTFRSSEPFLERATLIHTFLLAALASWVIPYLFNVGLRALNI